MSQRPSLVVDLAGIVAEIELGKIAMHVLFGAVLIGAFHATLEDREIAFQRIDVDAEASGVFLDAVVDGFVAGELALF